MTYHSQLPAYVSHGDSAREEDAGQPGSNVQEIWRGVPVRHSGQHLQAGASSTERAGPQVNFLTDLTQLGRLKVPFSFPEHRADTQTVL